MRKFLTFAMIIGVAIAFSSCGMLVRGGVNMASRSIQTAAEAEDPNVLQQTALTVTATTTSALQRATANNPGLQTFLGIRTQAPPPGAEETICNGNLCFTSVCGQFELLSAVGDACTGEVTITLLITQRLQSAPIRHSLSGIITIDEEGNSFEMIEPAPESEWRNLPYNVPVRVAFSRIGPVPISVENFIYVQAASWDNSFEGVCSPIFRNVPILWEECEQINLIEEDEVVEPEPAFQWWHPPLR